MWICASKTAIHRSFWFILLALITVASVFYTIQNQGGLPGGNIALPKLFWLATVIFCWYFIPILLILDQRLIKIKPYLALFLLNMLLRAIIELVMMYYTNNWHPYYGLGHDVFSILLTLKLASLVRYTSPTIATYLLAMAALFVIETGFAWYMLQNVHSGHGVVYYVPDGNSHRMVLELTTATVLAMAAYLIFFIRKWLYASSFKG